MKSSEKMKVVIKPFDRYGGKYWVQVTFLRSRIWVPSFEDLWRIIQAMCYCEDEKYPRGEGREMVKRFLVDSCTKMSWDEIKIKYQIPTRE